MMFSKTCQYGIRAVLYLAVHTNFEHKLGVKEIAVSLDAPQPFLAKILQKLSKQDLITSVKGPKGGFYLSEKNRTTTIEKVVECIDGSEVFSSCVLGLPVCSEENQCPLHVHAFSFREGLKYQLKHQNVDELARRIKREEMDI